jgi:thiol:disulfide interchange protein DsbD
MLLRPIVVASVLAAAASLALAGPPVSVDAKLGAETAAPGDPIEVIFHVVVPDGWHVYPPGSKEGVPLDAKLEPVAGVTPGVLEVRGGKQREIDLEGIGKVAIIEGTFDVAWKLQVAKDAEPGERKLAVKFSWQACNEQVCDMPKDQSFALKAEVGVPTPNVGPPVQLPAPEPVVATITLPQKQIHPGEKGAVALDLFVGKGWHIYAPGTEGDRATKLDLELPAGWTAGDMTGPPPTKSETDEIGKANLWEGKVPITRSFTAPATAKPGEAVRIKAHASWIRCNEKGCAPGDEETTLTLDVIAGAPVTTAETPKTGASDAKGGLGIGTLILTSISLGLLNILMPCTLPMIPITISIFSKGKKLTRGQSVFRASVYAAGIIISFAIGGGVIQAVWGNEGQAAVRTIASNGPLNLAIGALFVYFGLSFWGYWEIQLPEFLRSFVERSVDKAKTTAGPSESGIPLPALFLMGFFFVLTSYTCGAPLILGVLTAGLATPGAASVLIATAVFGATTAAPFFGLALMPGLLKSMPRSGGWFKTFKVTLGTIEIAAALKFFSNADLYWHDGTAGLLTRNIFLGLWATAGLFITIFVAHVIKLAHDEEATEPAPKFDPKAWLRAIPFLLVSIYLLADLNGANIPERGKDPLSIIRYEIAANLEAFLPPEKAGKGSHSFHAPEYANYDKALAAAKASGKPLFLEFTGHT